MDFEVRRDDLRQHRVLDAPVPEPGEGEVLLHLDHAALTANNVTYAAFGEMMGYWRFFPADDGWGRVPVWGFADVVASRADGIADGERVYGYFPMSTHLVVRPGRIGPASFVDEAAHRAQLPPVYNQYVRVHERADARAEHVHAVLRPLFTTSFLIDDWLADQDAFRCRAGDRGERLEQDGARARRAAARPWRSRGGGAHLGAQRRVRGRHGATTTAPWCTATWPRSTRRCPRCSSTWVATARCWPRCTVTWPTRCGTAARWERRTGTRWAGGPLPGPAPALFFAPDHVVRRRADWGGAGFDERVDASWDRFVSSADSWLEIVEHRGPDAVAAAFADVVDGRVPPHQAYVISPDA